MRLISHSSYKFYMVDNIKAVNLSLSCSASAAEFHVPWELTVFTEFLEACLWSKILQTKTHLLFQRAAKQS